MRIRTRNNMECDEMEKKQKYMQNDIHKRHKIINKRRIYMYSISVDHSNLFVWLFFCLLFFRPFPAHRFTETHLQCMFIQMWLSILQHDVFVWFFLSLLFSRLFAAFFFYNATSQWKYITILVRKSEKHLYVYSNVSHFICSSTKIN